jgi:hypothetical protein
MASPPRSALDDELPYELGKSSGGSDVPESLRGGPRVERWTCSPYCHTRRAYDQPPAQTGDCPFLELTPVTDTPSDASTMPSTPWHGYGSRFKAMPTFFYFIAFCYIIDSPKQHFQPAYGMYASISFRRGPPLAISAGLHHGCSRLQQSDRRHQLLPNQCPLVSFIRMGDALPAHPLKD